MTSPGSQPPQSSPIDKALELVRKIGMPGGVTLGGAGAIWHYFIQEDIPRTIGSAIIGLAVSYGATILGPLHKSNQRRLQQVGQALDTVTDQAIAAATGFENKYLLCQAAECQAFKSEGMTQHDGIFIPLLKEVFVPLELGSSAMEAGFQALELDKNPEKQRELTIWTFLAQAQKTPTFRQLAVLAWGGYGKTTLLRHIAFRYGIKQTPKGAPKLVPILLILRQYKDLLAQENPPDLPQLITDHHLPDLPGADNLHPPKDWALSLLKSGKALVMLDGFDEVGTDQRSNVAKWLTAQMRRYGQSVFLLTSRPKAYREQPGNPRLQLSTSLWVKDFNALQRKQFVTRWYECQERYANAGRETPDVKKTAARAAQNLLSQIESQPALKKLAKNPLLLNMIVTFHRRVPGTELPKRKVELYREICRLQLLDRPRARGVGHLMTQCNAQGILQQIAFAMMQRQWKRIDQKVLLQGLTQIIKQQDDQFATKDFLKEVVQISELLVKQEDQYEFAHLSFQEYLAAAHIAQTKKEQVLYPQFDNDWWKPTILLYAGLVSPTRLMREAVQRGAHDLAYQCLQETTKQVDPQIKAELALLKQTVVNARYADLETYLKNGEWKKADDETYRLMITTVGREEEQRFTSDELLDFPCDELQTIDRLWVTHSQGKYGFSIQKEIYLNCGGKFDGKYDPKNFEKFGDAVAWKRNDFWEFRMQWDNNGPSGHLPLKCVLGGEGEKRLQELGKEYELKHRGGGRAFLRGYVGQCFVMLGSPLFSRIQACKL